jgi:hypothetical protein
MQVKWLQHPLQALSRVCKRSRQLAVSDSNPEPVDTTVYADPRVFPVPIGNETFLDIDGLDTGRIRIRHEHDQFVIIVCAEDRDSNQDIAEQIEIPRAEEATDNR